MAYEVKFTDNLNKGSIFVDDNTINQETSVNLPGRNSSAYGAAIAENFLHLLENFANTTEPDSPVEGQLWYDSSQGVNQLKVYDGTTWTSAGGLKKSTSAPDVANSITGDLWVDTENQQLYLFSGSGWILVGPEFSDGLNTGARPLRLLGTDNVNYNVLVIEVEAEPVAIISTDQFTPKTNITGFNLIKPGINLSSRDIKGDGFIKFNGTVEKAEALVVGSETVPATNFLRTDQSGITNFSLKIKDNGGLQIGASGQFSALLDEETGVIKNNTNGASIEFRVNNEGADQTVLSLKGNTVGVNNTAPTEALDITGNIKTSGKAFINSTDESTSFGTGSLVVKGGLGVAKNLNIGGSLGITGTLNAANIAPDTSNNRNLGTPTLRWGNVYANAVFGNVIGNVTGTVAGKATSSDKLASPTSFVMTGDVQSNTILFDGQTGGLTKTFETSLSNALIAAKEFATTVNNNDEILINKVTGTTGLFKATKAEFLSSVPVNPPGVIMPYAGTLVPDGWLLCDGSEVSKEVYQKLYLIIGDNFGETNDEETFALPDLRGRFPLGLDNMGGTAANRVTGLRGQELGNTGGEEEKNIAVDNLPEHEHDLKAPNGDQFYAVADGSPSDPSAVSYEETSTAGGQAISTSGGVLNGGQGDPLDVMNPFLSLNYIIYTGVN